MAVSLVSNPPYNMPWTPPPLAKLMPKYGGVPIPKNNANFAFILSALDLATGKAALLLPCSVLKPSSEEERGILKRIVDEDFLEAVVQLPGGMFESTGIPTCVLVLNQKKETKRIELVDLSASAEQVEREQRGQYGGAAHTSRVYKKKVNVLSKETIERTAAAVRDLAAEENFSVAVTPEQVEENDYKLTPKLYLWAPQKETPHRPFADIAADLNRIIRQKNAVQIRMNKTAAKRLGYDCLDVERPDLTDSFKAVGQEVEKEKFISFAPDDGIVIRCSTKDDVSPLIIRFLQSWKQWIMYWNDEENRLLAEFRDALLPKLMSGEIELEPKENC